MRPGTWRWAGALLMALNLAGCHSGPREHPYPPDPLFVTKKPVEAKAENAPPVTTTVREPVSPPAPPRAVVTRPEPTGNAPDQPADLRQASGGPEAPPRITPRAARE